MPTYSAIHKKTKKQQTFKCTIAELEIWQKENPKWDVLCSLPMIHSGFMNGESKSDGWRDILKTVKKSHPRSTIKV